MNEFSKGTLGHAAVIYAKAGWPVFPLPPSSGRCGQHQTLRPSARPRASSTSSALPCRPNSQASA